MFQIANPSFCLRCSKGSVLIRGGFEQFVICLCFQDEGLLARRPYPKVEDHPLLAVRDCLFTIFAAPLHAGSSHLHQQGMDAPCFGDTNPLVIKNELSYLNFIYLTFNLPVTSEEEEPEISHY
jgi:hypothetical protein